MWVKQPAASKAFADEMGSSQLPPKPCLRVPSTERASWPPMCGSVSVPLRTKQRRWADFEQRAWLVPDEISKVRTDLEAARTEGEGRGIRLKAESVELELQMTAKRDGTGEELAQRVWSVGPWAPEFRTIRVGTGCPGAVGLRRARGRGVVSIEHTCVSNATGLRANASSCACFTRVNVLARLLH